MIEQGIFQTLFPEMCKLHFLTKNLVVPLGLLVAARPLWDFAAGCWAGTATGPHLSQFHQEQQHHQPNEGGTQRWDHSGD